MSDIEIIDSKQDQPKPTFTLDDLEHSLDTTYLRLKNYIQFFNKPADPNADSLHEGLIEALGTVHELIAIIAKKKSNYESIEPSIEPTKEQEIISKAVGQDSKPQFYVAGVQLVENKVIVGTSLYSTMPKAKTIRDILNRKFAELKVNHEAKIQQYPVF